MVMECLANGNQYMYMADKCKLRYVHDSVAEILCKFRYVYELKADVLAPLFEEKSRL